MISENYVNQGRFSLGFFQIEAMMYLPCLMSIGIGITL